MWSFMLRSAAMLCQQVESGSPRGLRCTLFIDAQQLPVQRPKSPDSRTPAGDFQFVFILIGTLYNGRESCVGGKKVIRSVSQLLGEIGGLNSTRFAESLSVINGFASSDKAMQNTLFPGEVRDLTKRALTVLKATSQMRQQAQDPELLFDLQHSLANSYSATPELRKTWLQTMARHHSRLGNWSEV